jgi:spore germination protein (amino acid permease)
MFLYISLSPILRQIPNALAKEGGRNGFFSALWAGLAIIPLTGIVISLIKIFPGFNIYEIMVQLLGKFLAKILILSYLLWIFLAIASKVNIYALTLQFTLMPKTQSSFFMVVLIGLVYFTLLHGLKTVFRLTELTLGPILLMFIILIICAIPRVRMDYILPVSTISLKPTIMATKNVAAVGGNIIIALFFADKFGLVIQKEQMRKLWSGAGVFILISFLLTAFSFAITGPGLTAKLPFPFYITVKSISFFNIFERFEVIITLVCLLSDFISISIFSILLIRCTQWLLGVEHMGFMYVPLTMLIYYLTFMVSSTQFEFQYFYQNYMIYINLIFQFCLPLFLGIVCLFRRKKVQKQY